MYCSRNISRFNFLPCSITVLFLVHCFAKNGCLTGDSQKLALGRFTCLIKCSPMVTVVMLDV